MILWTPNHIYSYGGLKHARAVHVNAPNSYLQPIGSFSCINYASAKLQCPVWTRNIACMTDLFPGWEEGGSWRQTCVCARTRHDLQLCSALQILWLNSYSSQQFEASSPISRPTPRQIVRALLKSHSALCWRRN